ncbi:uncharacterized protein LOC130890724 [Diorhabda carinulata]|uniref:uncharacterized protein LOC130890724 n=1 Tax=Diorhabda carinulata TaxID=1163345 RepID=UPI0025A17AD0|nr:uncharacterized protein LOC130890724 [Diorhabda carinulata]
MKLLFQEIIIHLIFWKTLLNFCATEIVKRSPLELGFVTFPEVEKPRFVLFNMTKVEEVKSPEKDFHDFTSRTPLVPKISHISQWIQGEVKHHAFIPPHLQNIFMPVVISIKEPLAAVQQFYPDIIGGYGLGHHSGGQGAGHGYQIIFN